MSGSCCIRGARPPRVDPNAHVSRKAPVAADGPVAADAHKVPAAPVAAGEAVLPTHTVPEHTDGETAAPSRRPGVPIAWRVAHAFLSLALIGLMLGLIFFGFWMEPVVSIDSVSAAGLYATGAGTIAPSFQVAVRLKTRHFHLIPSPYQNGTIAVSCAGGAVTAAGELPFVVLTSFEPAVVSATVQAPATALSGDARDRLRGEVQRGEVRLDVSVVYPAPAAPWTRGVRVRCAATLLAQGNSTTSCPRAPS